MEPLKPEFIYHIYNHSNGDDLIFKEDQNYSYFLEKYRKFISPVADTYSYCLMPNHFHFLVKIKAEEGVVKSFNQRSAGRFRELKHREDEEAFISLFISKQFSNLFSSYTQSFNKMYKRRGSLFLKNFKRKPITNDDHLLTLIRYIHNNPVKHGFVLKPDNWKYSSYHSIITHSSGLVERHKVIEIFNDVENFILCHQQLSGM